MDSDNHVFPILTVDGAVFQLIGGKLTILLIQRAFEPFLGKWALPGAYISADETTRQALDRALVRKTGVGLGQIELIEQPFAFDAPKRDPRGNAVGIMYVGLCKNVEPGTHKGMNNAQNPQFLPVTGLPRLAYDHDEIVKFAHNRLKALAMNTNAAGLLLPKDFTLTQLQSVYEAIFCKPLDKRNFRKRILALGIIKDAGKLEKDGAHRPAKLYTLTKTKLQNFAATF